MTGLEYIAAERARQIAKGHYTAEHDDAHGLGELAMAASGYALPPSFSIRQHYWPFDEESWNPTDENDPVGPGRIRQLSKAGALIAAEIDRLERAMTTAK